MQTAVVTLVVFLAVCVTLLFWMFWRSRSGFSRWPAMEATITHAEVFHASPRTRPGFESAACWICKLHYVYKVKGRQYPGECMCAVPSEELAQQIADMKTGQNILIHYRIDAHDRNFLDDDADASLNRSVNLLRLGVPSENERKIPTAG